MKKLIELRNDNGVAYAKGIGVADAARILSADESLELSAHVDGQPVFTRYDDECEPEDIERKIRRRCPDVAPLVVAVAMLMASCTVTVPVAATGELDGSKEGRAASVQVLGITVQDHGTIDAAAKDGGIRYVETVHVRTTDVLGVFTRRVTIVTGH